MIKASVLFSWTGFKMTNYCFECGEIYEPTLQNVMVRVEFSLIPQLLLPQVTTSLHSGASPTLAVASGRCSPRLL